MEPITLILLLLALVISFIGFAVFGLHNAEQKSPKLKGVRGRNAAKAHAQQLDLNTQS